VETRVVIAADVAPALIGLIESEGADVVAMTSHGRGVSRLLVGSVADNILRSSHSAVLMFHPK
jgi:nucleotide-binding universal stress UspA family protein